MAETEPRASTSAVKVRTVKMAAVSSTSDNDIDAVHNGVDKIERMLDQSDAYSDCSERENGETREAGGRRLRRRS